MTGENDVSRRTILGTTGLTVVGALTGATVAGAQDETTQEDDEGGDDVEAVVSDWPDKQRETAQEMMDEYGTPEGVTERRLIWYDADPWKRIELFRDAVAHNFPMEHPDFLEQVIDYQVPPEKADELLEYDGSVTFERTKGELSARCDQEPANFLAINLAHDVATDEKSVEEARQEYAATVQRMMEGESPEYTQGFQFELPEGDQGDPDESILGQETPEDGGERGTTPQGDMEEGTATTEDGG